MKKIILTFGILLAGIFIVNAQDQVNNKATKLVNTLTTICALTSDQVTQIQPLAVSFVKDREANKQQYANDPTALKAANKTNNRNYKTKLYAILTPGQQAELNDYMAQRKASKRTSTSTGNE
jgi:dTDP-D-glucose 4,6-dehydratase